jgi:hypothetical protein
LAGHLTRHERTLLIGGTLLLLLRQNVLMNYEHTGFAKKKILNYLKTRELLQLLWDGQRGEVGDLRHKICHEWMAGILENLHGVRPKRCMWMLGCG